MDHSPSSGNQVKVLLDIFEQDRKHVMIFVSLCFAIPTFTLSHLSIREIPLWGRVMLVVSLALFVSAGLFFFRYVQRQNWKRLEGVPFILSGEVEELRDILMGPTHGLWARYGWLYKSGSFLLNAASVFYLLFLLGEIFPKT